MGKSGKARNRRQKAQASYSKSREELQLQGVLPTSPAGALRDERVDPSTQDSQRFPGLDRQAILNDGAGAGGGGGWSVPEHVRRKVIEQNAEVLFERRVVEKVVPGAGPGGKDLTVQVELPPDRAAQQQASKILLLADQRQYERDNPEQAGKAKGGVGVGVNVNIDNSQKLGILTRMVEQLDLTGAGSSGDSSSDTPPPELGAGNKRGTGRRSVRNGQAVDPDPEEPS